MKLQELHEATKYSQAAKILKALSGVKGVKVDVKAADYDDVNGNPLPETYMVTLTYTPARGVKPVEHVKFYETQDGDWEYLSDTIGDVTDSLESTAASLRKEMEYAQKFHSDTDNGDLAEGIGSKLFKAFWETTPKEIMRRQQELSDEEVLLLYGKGINTGHKGSPRTIQMRALANEIKRRKLELPKIDASMADVKEDNQETSLVKLNELITEGYEAKVLNALGKEFPSAYFENGVLWTSEDEYEGVLQAVKTAAKRDGFKVPTVRIDISVHDTMQAKVGDKR